MPVPGEINALIERFNDELDQIEQEATKGLIFVRATLERFPNNATLIQMFAFLTNAIFFVETQKRKIQALVNDISSIKTAREEIQELAEELANELGKTLETKIIVNNINNRLESLQ